MTQIDRDLRGHRRDFTYFKQRVDQFMTYSMDFNSALAQMFNNRALNSGPDVVQFPNVPVFADDPREDEEEEEEEGEDVQ